ncbi:MAG: CCA tRNA nucleotidyltransferase, partial [Caldilineaceae bacterium]|nr:CCA tRNA nucleotidyltransferase [Caldilineaceae bacterium]
MDKNPISWQPQHPAFQALLQTVVADAAPVYVVGGVVRDHLLGTNKKLTDLDLVVQENALAVARRAANKLGWAYYALDEARDVARLVFSAGGDNPLVCDVAGMRGPSIVSDLADRDFTINAMAFELLPNRPVTLLDNHNGRQDLAARLVRRVNATSLVTDPLRLLRAVRFAGQLGFTIEQETQAQIVRLTSALKLTSA